MNTVDLSSVQANAAYAVLVWEPVAGSGERLNVGALAQFSGGTQGRPLIREEVLRCMYGAAGEGAYRMIVTTLKAVEGVAKQFGFGAACDAVPLASFSFTKVRETRADSDHDLFRQIVLMHFSLSVLAEEPLATADDSPTPEREVNQQWTTRVKEAIQAKRPDLQACFNRELVLVDGSSPVRFPVLTPRLVAQFGLLKENLQSQGMEDARAKMWKLSLARDRNPTLTAAMVVGMPALDNVTLSDRVRDRFVANIGDLIREAQKHEVDFRTAQTVVAAADCIIELA